MKDTLLGRNRKSHKVKKGTAVTSSKQAAAIREAREKASSAQEHLNVQSMEYKLEQEAKQAEANYAKKKADSSSVFKRKKKDTSVVEEHGESILDKLGEGNTAQDLLHQSDDEDKGE